MSELLSWLFIGWVLISALATPFVARLVASTFDDEIDDRRNETARDVFREHVPH